uniref:non-specific serine/threonine protein kinase n=1 Tax=Denticeps clupeoides TaxID=299321 RepID=A0AAY4B8P8_9TELE
MTVWSVVRELIGNGSFGQVYKAKGLQTGELFAIKVTPFRSRDITPKQEVEIMQRIYNNNLMSPLAIYYWKQKLYICMDLCCPGALSNLYRKLGPFEENEIAFVAKEVLQGLQYLNDFGYMHRDIKSDNIIINEDGEVKITDFGLTGRIEDREDQKEPIGTPQWMAPEVSQAQEHGKGYSHNCDIWSLGITMIELAEARLPLQFDPPETVYTFWSEQKASPQLNGNKEWSNSFQSFVQSALTMDPSMRPTAKELLKHKFVRNQHSTLSPLKERVKRLQHSNYNVERVIKKSHRHHPYLLKEFKIVLQRLNVTHLLSISPPQYLFLLTQPLGKHVTMPVGFFVPFMGRAASTRVHRHLLLIDRHLWCPSMALKTHSTFAGEALLYLFGQNPLPNWPLIAPLRYTVIY